MIDNFGKFGWSVAIRIKNGQTIKEFPQKILITAKRKPDLIETDDDEELVNQVFTDFLIKNNTKRYSRNTSFGPVFAEKFNRIIGDLLTKPFLEEEKVIGLI